MVRSFYWKENILILFQSYFFNENARTVIGVSTLKNSKWVSKALTMYEIVCTKEFQ